MEKISLNDIVGNPAYEKMRDDFLRSIIKLKNKRRVLVGDRVSLVFENRGTVIFQIQEMLRAERIADLDKVREEIEIYNGLIPESGELSATLFMEIEDQNNLRDKLLEFLGIDEALYLKIGNDHSIHARFEAGRSKEDKISAVQYVRFPFKSEQIKAFAEGKERIRLVIDHPNYQAETELNLETRRSLIEDLTL